MDVVGNSPKEISQDIFCLYGLFSALSAPKTMLFGTLIRICSECSETVGGLLCGQQDFLRINMLHRLSFLNEGHFSFLPLLCYCNSEED